MLNLLGAGRGVNVELTESELHGKAPAASALLEMTRRWRAGVHVELSECESGSKVNKSILRQYR